MHPKLSISSKAVKIIERLLRKTMVKISKIASKNRKNPILLETDVSVGVRKVLSQERARLALYSAPRNLIGYMVDKFLCPGMSKI